MPTTYDIVGNLSLKCGNQNNTDGAEFKARGGRQGELIASMLHGSYHQAVLDGRVFSASNQAAVSTTAALATTWTGCGLYNPPTSGFNASLLAVGVAQLAAGVAGGVGLLGAVIPAGSASGMASAITPVNRRLGGPASSMVIDDGATIVTPTLIEVFGSLGSLATSGYGLMQGLWRILDGSLIVVPGSFVGSYTTGATSSATIWTFIWEEVPV